MSPARTFIGTTLAVAFGLCLVAGQAAAQAFPRVGLYGQVVGGGYPYVKPDFTLDTLEIARTARYNEVVLDVFPISPYRPDIVLALKARNPNCRVLAYVLAQDIWNVNDAD